ncbi:uncharacterized protein LOC116843815 [Odontomachus brunneus]|uniref:uncharacterized protein LOC116843815 n=1 Tax=Odontomachus brunneus TaxID=486640 RepID=UPI0013F2A309|nr:uncharacterized protein LOC116843815 [Odontomachus brunneus]XP_032670480.1 uncharacterized protein LOC116843815 [Odontomachus brunneus]XP_032670481.1 uncharacterized protein LOC116843815 [Odontomachus brunneus]XP_032670482.1 uncharacterized protein LOC116843815 [Odontomachus brunneus]XP_032670484.1 uncharacterized protein LOC116843815 [Odontomachus brunneus]XP_032670485.1 uncharacterized protein LOC116843815 [Odontomachus brunneus]
MSTRTRRPSVSIYDYPEHLNPFNEDITNSQPPAYREGKTPKESRHKFWTFGRSRKKRSHSFSIKSTWNGLFGKRKEAVEPIEKRSTITTVSTTYKRESYDKPIVPARLSKDQQEFDEALGTLARRRKYTLDNNASRYNSSSTVNGDPARIYDGSPQDTTTSIMGDLTPKPPARRFGQVSPRPTDKIPPLNFEEKQSKENGNVSLRDKEEAPIPPLRRFGNRSSQRLNGGTLELDEEASRSGDVTLRDENENVPEDYVFKRFSQDAVRRSNLSINSCVSVTSTASTYGRKKRRAPQPPQRKEQLETPQESDVRTTDEATNVELKIVEPIDIVRVTENIDELTRKNCELKDDKSLMNENTPREEKKQTELSPKITKSTSSDGIVKNIAMDNNAIDDMKEREDSEATIAQGANETFEKIEIETVEEKSNESVAEKDSVERRDDSIDVEYQRTSQEKIEIIKDTNEEEVCLRRKDSSSTLSRSDSFSVKEEIEKIERQIKALESKNAYKEHGEEEDNALTSPRLSIQANRRHFFENMVSNGQSGVKIEFKELPREQKDFHVVRLTDAPLPVAAPREPVKVIELHISEPIRHKPELLNEVNPIPKPRRHSALSLNDVSESTARLREDENGSPEQSDKRGKSF